jgi:eukaryotic-like serine/threonine-protein kinase
MSPERRRKVEELYRSAMELEPELRGRFLARSCGNDYELLRELEARINAGHGNLDRATERQEGSATSTIMLAPGMLVGRYKIEALLGEGGMGQVFRAHDTRLGRTVAIKLVRAQFAASQDFRRRLEREARSISALNHPNICALHDVGEQDGSTFLVMEYVEGEPLAALLKKGWLPWEDVVRYGSQIAGALAAAHAKHIIHRDLKPQNIIVTPIGVKVLDFGLAKHFGTEAEGVSIETSLQNETQPGHLVGTPAYMSPEQISGKPLDARSDIFALGSVMYEMLCGCRPFQGDTTLTTLSAVLHKAPDPPHKLRPEIPAAIEEIVLQCLEKQPEARFLSADDLHHALSAQQPSKARGGVTKRTAAIAAALIVVLAGGSFGIREYILASRIRWVERTVPDIARLINENRRLEAVKLYRKAQEYAPASPALFALAEGVASEPVSFQTKPAGAQVYISDYMAAAGDDLAQWQLLGTTPLKTSQIPRWGYYRVRAEKQGFAPVVQTFFPVSQPSVEVAMTAASIVPAGMVWVPAGFVLAPVPPQPVAGFWMGAYEVTNREFKQFVDAGGYQKPKYWKYPFIKSGKPLTWQQAMEEFRDATRRPGPASWQLGAYTDGTAAMPVGGVSWYEAAAYAEFAGKSLPTIYEWFLASGGPSANSEIIASSNFGGKGPGAAGTHRGMAPFGTYDMAGNVSEWAVNANGDRRYLLGGAWDEEPGVFLALRAEDPMARAATFGFRCVQRVTPAPQRSLDAFSFQLQGTPVRSKPLDDRTFKIFADLQAYDKTDLAAKVEQVEDSSPYWRRETITFPAAYGAERMMVHLFLPKNSAPPYQVVALVGGVTIFDTKRVQDFQFPYEFFLRAGRAVVIPVLSGTLERGPSPPFPPINQERERALRWPKDMGQTIDYLESRRDIDTQKLGYYGTSTGAMHGVRLIALERRFKAAALTSGGLMAYQPQETDAWNYAPRVRIPVLMLNGRDDFLFPVETVQKPLFNALGTPAPDKKYVQFEGGHVNLFSRPDLIGEILEWFDRYLGPVKLRP